MTSCRFVNICCRFRAIAASIFRIHELQKIDLNLETVCPSEGSVTVYQSVKDYFSEGASLFQEFFSLFDPIQISLGTHPTSHAAALSGAQIDSCLDVATRFPLVGC